MKYWDVVKQQTIRLASRLDLACLRHTSFVEWTQKAVLDSRELVNELASLAHLWCFVSNFVGQFLDFVLTITQFVLIFNEKDEGEKWKY